MDSVVPYHRFPQPRQSVCGPRIEDLKVVVISFMVPTFGASADRVGLVVREAVGMPSMASPWACPAVEELRARG